MNRDDPLGLRPTSKARNSLMMMFFAVTGIVALAIIGSVTAKFLGLGAREPLVLPSQTEELTSQVPLVQKNLFSDSLSGVESGDSVEVLGTINSEVKWTRSAGVYRYFISDDVDAKIYLEKMTADQLQLYTFNPAATFRVSGIYSDTFDEARIDVKTVSIN